MRIRNKFMTLVLAVVCSISIMTASVKAETMYDETGEEIIVMGQPADEPQVMEGKLEAPKNLRIDTSGNECYTTAVAWDKVEGASKYEVEYYRNGEKKTYTAYSPYYPISALAGDWNYVFKVRAVNSSGESSEWSKPIEYQYVSPGKQLAVPDNVKWDDSHFGTVTWNPVEGASGYRIILKCNGKSLGGYSGKFSTCSYDFSSRFNTEGIYTVTVYAYPPDINVCGSSQAGESNEFSYILPEQKISTPANFQVDTSNLLLRWDAIEGVTSYYCEIYWNGEKQFSGHYLGNAIDLEHYLDKQEGSGELLIRVQAESYDRTRYADSDWAEFRYVKPSKKLETPTNVKWSTEHFGEITWNPVEGAERYEGTLYCNGKEVITFRIKSCEIDFCRYMFDDGVYTVTISAVPTDLTAALPSDETVSAQLNYKVPAQKASTPTNIRWEGTVLKWDAVENVSWYSVKMNQNGQFSFGVYPSDTSYDMKPFFERHGDGIYTVQISALSDDLTKCGHSDYAAGPEYVVGEQTPEYPDEQEEQVRNFVKRLYQVILNREAEEDGLNAWTKQLLAGKATGAQIVAGFVESDEFTQRGLSNEEVIEIMYQAMLGRASDESGKAGWSKILNNGCSYLNIVNGFSGSAEFNEICGNYGITAGTVELNRQRDKNPQLTAFVARCYTQALNRQYEIDGLEAWCDAIISKRNTPKQVAQNFIFSDEFTQKNLSTKEYVEVLYRTFMGREADEEGLAAWIEVLESGREDRAKVLEGFSDSVEFDGILQSFGLN